VKFQPRPENPFPEFIETYFQRCKQLCPKLQAIAGKWTFEDLIPGMSDFDTRLIFTDDASVSDWARMSIAVGEVHTQLAQEFPHWARILEHLPGLNLMHKEVINPVFYYPEFQQWTYYQGDEKILDSIRSYLAAKPWTTRDELFHLKKIAVYYGPYQRGIDPAVNMGAWENKYPLHSRFMHYFTPPIQSALSIIHRRGLPGKFESLRLARETFPHPEVIDRILETVDQHYEIEEYYQEPKLGQIEQQLENYLREVIKTLAKFVTLIKIDSSETTQTLKSKISAIPVDPMERFYEGVKFCRFMKGRLLFYATPITWFDSTWLIHNELGRIVKNFCEQPLNTFGMIWFNENLPARAVLDRLKGNILSSEICDGVRQFMEIAGMPMTEGQEKIRAREVADVFEPVQVMVETLGDELQHKIF